MSVPRRVTTVRPGRKGKPAGRKPKPRKGSRVASAFNWIGNLLLNILSINTAICEISLAAFRASVCSIFILIALTILPVTAYIGLMIPGFMLYTGYLLIRASVITAIVAIVIIPLFFYFFWHLLVADLQASNESEKIRGSELAKSGPESARKPAAKTVRPNGSTRFTPTANRLRRTK